VLGEGGEAIRVDGGRVEISRDGSVFVSDDYGISRRGIIGVHTFEESAAGNAALSKALSHAGENLFQYHGAGVGGADESQVAQGFLEQSTVNVVEELVNMMKGFRAYEANMMALRNQDATLQRAVSQVGRISPQ
jgi:flagellar basal-body rod protein FlgG